VASLERIENLRGICKAYIDFKIEIEGQRKPACKARPSSSTTLNNPPPTCL
jgi:hypothetical protein